MEQPVNILLTKTCIIIAYTTTRAITKMISIGSTMSYFFTNKVDFFYSGIQFYSLLTPYLCFISLLYLDLCVLGDDALSPKSYLFSGYGIIF